MVTKIEIGDVFKDDDFLIYFIKYQDVYLCSLVIFGDKLMEYNNWYIDDREDTIRWINRKHINAKKINNISITDMLLGKGKEDESGLY